MNYFLKPLILIACLSLTTLSYAGAKSTLTIKNNRPDIEVTISPETICSSTKKAQPLNEKLTDTQTLITATWDNCFIGSRSFLDTYYSELGHTKIFVTLINKETQHKWVTVLYPENNYPQTIFIDFFGKDVELYLTHTELYNYYGNEIDSAHTLIMVN